MLSTPRRRALVVRAGTAVLFGLGLSPAFFLVGCGVSGDAGSRALPAEALAGPSVKGIVHGGAYPIQHANIHLMETQSNGYGGAAKDVLAAIGVTVTSDANGNFNIPDANGHGTQWTCDAGQYAYLTVSGGYTVAPTAQVPATTNNNVVQVAAVGPCSELGTSGTVNRDTVQVYLSELSTVAAAYALGNFITVDDTNASTGQQVVNISAPTENNASSPACSGTGASMVCTAGGLAHAFTNAYVLVDAVALNNVLPTGQARAVSPYSAASTLPQAMLNTIGNILQRCVDSVPASSSACSTLFSAATPASAASAQTTFTPGSGMAPTNTLEVALNMAKYPTTNVSSLYTQQPRLAFFTPQLTSAPDSFNVSIFYGIPPNAAQATTIPSPIDLALDYQDDAYVLYQGVAYGTAYSAVTAITSTPTSNKNQSILYTGVPTGSAVFPAYPTQIATDTLGNFFVTNNDPTVAANGAVYTGSTATGVMLKGAVLKHASGVAVDHSNNIWASVADTTDDSVVLYSNASVVAGTSNAAVAGYSGVYGFPVLSLAIDGNEEVWGVGSASSGNSYATLFADATTKYCLTRLICTNSSTWVSGQATLTAGGGVGIAVGSSSNAFIPLTGAINMVTGTITPGLQGVVIVNPQNPSANVSAPASATVVTATPSRTELDGNGNVYWADNSSGGVLNGYVASTGLSYRFLPCYPFTTNGVDYACETSANTATNLRGLAIDSTGAVWTSSSAGVVAQVLGWAAPTWPQLSYGHPSVQP